MAGLYVHIPFCIKKCFYCDFLSFPDHSGMREYIDALIKEAELLHEKPDIETVFWGGGTPSTLPAGAAGKISAALEKVFHILPDAERTIEVNPGTATKEKLEEYRRTGFNRLSIGLQAMQDSILKKIGRIHSYRQFLETYQTARRAGFENINVDIMYGLPGQKPEDYLDTVKALTGFQPEHVSAYSLIVEEGTPLFDSVQKNELQLPDEDETFEMQQEGKWLLQSAGYHRYEISNYSKHGKECRHNINYWENGEYSGLGLGAHSAIKQDGWVRSVNTTSLEEYIEILKSEKLPVCETQTIQPSEEMFESVMLGLRMIKGIDLLKFKKRFGISFERAYPKAVSKLKSSGLIKFDPDFAALTEEGLDYQNRVLLLFLDN